MVKKGLTVEEGIKALSEVYKDANQLIAALKHYAIGTQEGTLIRLTDIRDKKIINKVRADLKKLAEANPDRKMLIFYGFAGHGMQLDGEQVVIINQFNKRTGFYEWWAAEADIRLMAKKYSNTFSVGIFACCREIFKPAKHCGLFEGTKQEAIDFFTEIVTTRIESLKAEDTKKKVEAIKKMNDLQIQKLAQIEANEDKKHESKCKSNCLIESMKLRDKI